MLEKVLGKTDRGNPAISHRDGAIGDEPAQTLDRRSARLHDGRPTETFDGLQQRRKLEEVVAKVSRDDGIIVHTLVDDALRNDIVSLSIEMGVPSIDSIDRVEIRTDRSPSVTRASSR